MRRLVIFLSFGDAYDRARWGTSFREPCHVGVSDMAHPDLEKQPPVALVSGGSLRERKEEGNRGSPGLVLP